VEGIKALVTFKFKVVQFIKANFDKNQINKTFVAVEFRVDRENIVKHAKTFGKINNIFLGKGG
jgi:hypothetical protein